MIRPPEVEVLGGSPTPEEERAVREAIVSVWREETARAALGESAWARAGKLEAAGDPVLRGVWSRSLGFTRAGVVAARRVGRGDTR